MADIVDEKDKLGLDNITVTDSQGFVISRVKNAKRRGDNIFLSTEQGRLVSQGNSTSGFAIGLSGKLSIISDYPIKNNNELQGAIFAAKYLQNSFANSFKKEIGNVAEIIFYTKKDGVVGSSVNDPSLHNTFIKYFTPGSDWIQNGKTAAQVTVPFSGTYFVNNVVFHGINGKSSGGMLILFPQTTTLIYVGIMVEIICLAILLSIFFCIRHIFLGRFREHHHNTIVHVIVISIVGLIYVLGIYIYCTGGYIVTIDQSPLTIYNSTFTLSPNNQIYTLQDEQTVKIVANSGGEAVNLFEAHLDYDPKLISINAINTSNSICNSELFVEKSIDSKNGQVNIICGIPTPGFTAESGVVAELNITHKKPGDFTLIFASTTMILANDGLGTNVLRFSENGSYKVVDPNVNNILLFSPSNPDSEKWYNNRKVSFSILAC